MGSLEAATMELVWAAGRPVIVHDIVTALNERREVPLAYTTVMTVMNNLVVKDLLQRERQGRSYSYTPVEDRDAHTARIMAETLSGSKDRKAALVDFVERLGPEEAAALRAALHSSGEAN